MKIIPLIITIIIAAAITAQIGAFLIILRIRRKPGVPEPAAPAEDKDE